MRISLIVAQAQNRVIGREGKLPWKLSADLKKFKELTLHHTVLMGRKTYHSIGRPLPQRRNLVLSRQPEFGAEGVAVFQSRQDAVEAARSKGERELFVIGGSEIYNLFLDSAQRIYLTLVQTEVAGDAYFPKITEEDWEEIHRESYPADVKNDYNFDFIILERKGQS